MFSSYGGYEFGNRQFTFVKHYPLSLLRFAWQMAASVFNVWVWMILLFCVFGVGGHLHFWSFRDGRKDVRVVDKLQ